MASNRIIGFVLLAISLAGIAVAAYLTSVHYAGVPLACGSNGVIDCERVLTSSYSEVAGVPWSVGGIVWFAVVGAMALPLLRRDGEPSWLQPAQLAWSLLGLLTVLYLVKVEVVDVKKVCIWCTSMHALILLTLALSLLRAPAVAEPEAVSRP